MLLFRADSYPTAVYNLIDTVRGTNVSEPLVCAVSVVVQPAAITMQITKMFFFILFDIKLKLRCKSTKAIPHTHPLFVSENPIFV